MPQARLSVRKIKELLRLHSLGLKQHQIARSCAIAQSIRGEVCTALGETDRAFALLEQAVEWREATLRSMKHGFDWDPVRADARFQAIFRKLWPTDLCT